MPPAHPTRVDSRRWDGVGGLLVLVVASLACVGLPGLNVLWNVAREILDSRATSPTSALVPWGLLGTTFLSCGGVAFLATALSIPAAIVVRQGGWRWGVWVCTPLLLPSYLAYSGWGLLRAPRTMLGDAIERAAQGGATWLPTFVGELLAVGGLVLWSWPIAATLLALQWSRVESGALEALLLDSKGAQRWRSLARMGAPGAGVAWVATTLVMLGSPVPFHLAQVPTISMEVWRRLMEEPTPARAWASALPVMMIVTACVLVAARSAFDPTPASQEFQDHSGVAGGGPAARSRGSMALLIVLLTCSVLVPLGLFLGSIGDWHSVVLTLRSLRPAIENSGFVAMIVVVVGLVITLGSWRAFSSFNASIRRTARVCLFAFLLASILPGVLVGSALAAFIALVDSDRILADSSVAVAMGHVARFAFVPALVGWRLAMTEPSEARDLRRVEGVGGLRGYVAGVLPTQLAALLGVGAMLTAFSLHEIESAIMLTPPGGGGLAHRVLGFLHYSRMEDLSVTSSGLALLAIGLATGVGLLGGRWGKGGRLNSQESDRARDIRE